MRSSFPSREQLEAMPVNRLRHVDIADKEEEELVQEILSAKLSLSPEAVKEITIKVPDIKTKEQEDYWQKLIDEARAKTRTNIAEQGAIKEEVKEEVKEEKPKGRPKKSK